LKDVLVFLAAAGLVVPLFHRARIGAVLGFLCVGIAVGPYGFGRLAEDVPWIRYLTIEDRARVEPFAELGVLFLLFLIGLELSLARLWSLRRYVAGIGGLQFALSALAIGGGLAVLGVPGSGAIVLGLGLAMSSTAIVMQLLEEQGRSTTTVGRVALAVLLFQDLMVAPSCSACSSSRTTSAMSRCPLPGRCCKRHWRLSPSSLPVATSCNRSSASRPRAATATSSWQSRCSWWWESPQPPASRGSRPRSALFSSVCCCRRPNTATRSRSTSRRSRGS